MILNVNVTVVNDPNEPRNSCLLSYSFLTLNRTSCSLEIPGERSHHKRKAMRQLNPSIPAVPSPIFHRNDHKNGDLDGHEKQ